MNKRYTLPKGAIQRVAAELGVSQSLVSKVARGERRNVIVEEALLKVKREHEARMKRIERMKAKLDELQVGTIDTRQQ